MKNKRLARWALIAVALLALAGAGYALVKSGLLEEINSVEDLRALIGRAGPMAGVACFLLQMMTVIVAPIPSNVTMMAGALALGEPLSVGQIVGAAVIVAGVYTANASAS